MTLVTIPLLPLLPTLMLLLLVACGDSQPSDTSTALPIATFTPAPPTAILTPTPTATLTQVSPTATPTQLPMATSMTYPTYTPDPTYTPLISPTNLRPTSSAGPYDLPITPMCSNQVDTPLPKPLFEVTRSRADVSRPTVDRGSRYSGSLIDVHVHMDPPGPNQDININALMDIANTLEANGVDIAVFMPTPNDGRFRDQLVGVAQRVALKNVAPDNVKLFAGSNYITYWLHQICHDEEVSNQLSTVLAQLSEDLSSSDYIGVGEIGVLHFRKKPGQQLIAFQPNFAPFLDIVEEIAKHDLWLDLHIEPIDPGGVSHEDWAFGGLQLLLDRNPTLKIILSHTAMTNPSNARRILETYPTVMMSIKPMTPTRSWKNLEPVLNSNREVYEDWATLFEEMPDRFVIGSDAKFMREGFTLDTYGNSIEIVRLMLGNLSPEAARKIAYDNARIMFPDE